MGISLARRRKVDYVIKNLKWSQRHEINKALDKINSMITDGLMEREKGYPTLKDAFKLDDVDVMIEMYRERFLAINALMIKNGLAPLFEADVESDPYLLNSSREYSLWTKERHIDVIKKELDGSTFADYVPMTYEQYLEKKSQKPLP